MSRGDKMRSALQRKAREDTERLGTPVATDEYLLRHALESFLDRLTKTPHADDFVLKGGILLAVYGIRRPTKDVDAEAVSASITEAHITEVLADVAAVSADDGVEFDLDTVVFTDIRDGADYPGLRVRIATSIGAYRGLVSWDLSTGDPVVPAPVTVEVPRVLGDPIRVRGYAVETTIAEKGVTILERGTSSTRWRDYVDIVQLAARGIDPDALLASARAVARHRGVELRAVAPVVAGYGDIAQTKWAAWRRKERVQAISEAELDHQLARVAAVVDPIFLRGLRDTD